MDEAAKKEALRLFTYGLYAVSCGEPDQPNAFTANWLGQVSFDPPLVVVSVDNGAYSLDLIRKTKQFAINVFAADERALSGTLGKSFAQHPEKLEGVNFAQASNGCPVLSDTPAWVACDVINEVPAGDSTLFLGRVVDARLNKTEEPLTMRAAGFKHAG